MYMTVIAALEVAWLPGHEVDTERCHPWVAYPPAQFLDGLFELQRHRPGGRILHVGCGIGTKLAFSALAGFIPTGIEIRPEYAASARRFLKAANCIADIIEVDAIAFDRYHEFECIYLYRPFVRDEDETALEDRILDQVNKGAVLFWPLASYPAQRGWHQVAPAVWAW